MCGIGGILRIGPRSAPATAQIPDAWLALLDRALAHRGPDDAGIHRDATPLPGDPSSTVHIALVHRRLAIIDPACAAQPMVRGQGAHSHALVFNGCIYNHRTLRTQLTSYGVHFDTDHADTEALLQAVRTWGDDGLGRCDGMFALGLWDRARATLLLARDTAGEKPLYYTTALPFPGVAFASTAAALAQLLIAIGKPPTIDPAAIARWLRFGFADVTPWTEIQALPPGTQATFGAASDNPRPRMRAGTPPRPLADASDAKSLIFAAVRKRLDADVPIGCFLSGGVDSSIIAAAAQAALREHGRVLSTFTVRMPNAAYDESEYAQQAASALGTSHRVLDTPPPNAAPADLERLIAQMGLPFADSSLLPTYWISAAARHHVKVALTGDGADELFYGYDRYRAAGLLEALSPIAQNLPTRLFASLSAPRAKGPRSRLVRLARAAKGDGYLDLISIIDRLALTELMGEERSAASAPEAVGDPRAQDLRFYLPDDILRKTDTGSMAVALETRAPFLARAVWEAAQVTRQDVHTSGGRPKALLRAVARQLVPAAIVDRPKMGFAIPIGAWLRDQKSGLGPLAWDLLTSPDPFPGSVGALIPREPVRRMLDQHRAGAADHSQRIYGLLVMALWCRWFAGVASRGDASAAVPLPSARA